jgi:hypothetical protein
MRAALAAAAVAVAALSACATPTPYQASQGEQGFGYHEEAIEAGRVRLVFRGNSITERQTVEDYLLYRAAELALERGAEHFTLVGRDVESLTRPLTEPRFGRSGFHYAYFSPYRGWSPFYDPFWDDVTTRDITRYEASAEVVFGEGPKPADDPNAYNARAVYDTLGARVMRPPQG